MILRRITEHVRAQNWFAVALDFVIVVVGVFVGLQVNNWNAARLEREESAVFTERLRDDLREEAWSYSYLIEYSGDVVANAERVVGALSGKAELSDEGLLISAYRATQYIRRLHQRSAFEELSATGKIGLIRDQKLRETSIRMFSTGIFDRYSAMGVGSAYRQAFRSAIPTEVQRALRDNCGDRDVATGDMDGAANSLDYECSTGLSAHAVAEAAEALRAYEGLVPMLRQRIADLETYVGDLQFNNREILETLKEEDLKAVAGS